MAMLPHWLDAHAEQATTVEEFFTAIAGDSKAKHAFTIAQDRAKLVADENQDTHRIGEVPSQTIRLTMLDALNDPQGSTAGHKVLIG